MVQGDRVTTVNGKMEVGTVATQVEVTGTPLLNAVDTTSGYVLATQAINNTPLGTGSFTRLAILSPGLSADFMNTSRSNAGFGNQRYGPTDSAIRAIAPGVEHLVLYLRRRHARAALQLVREKLQRRAQRQLRQHGLLSEHAFGLHQLELVERPPHDYGRLQLRVLPTQHRQ